MKLIGTHPSPYTRKVRIVAAEKKVELELVIDDPWSAETLVQALNPLGKIPILVLDDGATLFDSRVIVEYLDNCSPVAKLIPATNRERIEVRRWEALADGVIDAGAAVRIENMRPPEMRDAKWIDRQMAKLAAGLGQMDRELAGKVWCAGAGFTLADIAVGSCLGWLDFRYPALEWRKSSPTLGRLMQKLSDRQSFMDTVPREAAVAA